MRIYTATDGKQYYVPCMFQIYGDEPEELRKEMEETLLSGAKSVTVSEFNANPFISLNPTEILDDTPKDDVQSQATSTKE